jgi:uncharacterized protein YecT (DUF1311 family)
MIFIPVWQQIAWLDTETGETGEQRLANAGGDAGQIRASYVRQQKTDKRDAALLNAAQEAGVSGSRSHREQPAGAPGR